MTAARTRPQQFWQDEALPDIRDFRRHTTSIRKAKRAAIQTFHMHEYVWQTYRVSAPAKVFGTTSTRKYADHLIQNEPEGDEFRLIRDVANSHKHVKLGDPARIIASAKDLGLAPHDSFVWLFFPSWLVGTIVVDILNGTTVPFAPALDKVVAMWERLIMRDGL